MKRSSLVALVLAGFLSACGTPTPYAPAADGGYGYQVQKLEENRFRVAFAGNTLTARETVENYLLYRAAELTLEQGGGHFIVVGRDVDADTTWHTTYDSPYYDPWPNRYRWYPGAGPFWDRGTTRPVTRYEAYAEILVQPGPKRTGDPMAFDAQEVVRNLGPRIARTGPAMGG